MSIITLPPPALRERIRALPEIPAAAAAQRAWRTTAAHRVAPRLALATITIGALLVTLVASSGPNVLVPRSEQAFPNWEAGPLHGLVGRPLSDPLTLYVGMSVISLAMLVAYLVLVSAPRRPAGRMVWGTVLALHGILLLCPPLPLTDLFNYIGYARLGALHGINPYQHGIGMEVHDPIYRLTTWHHLRSPYGPLFTLASYGVGRLPLASAYWLAKLVVVVGSLGFIALVARCARRLGRDPLYAVLFVAANPVFLLYELGGFHNDFFMLLPSMAAIALLLGRRDRGAGAVLMLAVAVKFTAILLLPFLLLGAGTPQRRRRMLAGAGIGALPLAALSIAAFGFTLPNLSDQSTLLTDFSVPNMAGWLLGLGGGAPLLLRAATVGLVAVVALLLRSRRDWLEGAGWATFALILSLAWLVPWYVVWLLPLAALGTSAKVRRCALVLTVYLVLTFMPVAGPLLALAHIDPMSGGPGQTSRALQAHLGG